MAPLENTVIKTFLPAGGNDIGRTYAWTFAAGILYAGSSFLMLMVVTRILNSYWGGVFSIALALSQQLITIGYFQVRTFQVSDTVERFSPADYYASRVATCAAMLLAGIAWIAFGGFSRDKSIAILLLVVLKTAESFSNVLEGRYQQKNRYDAACRDVFFKTLIPLAGFVVSLAVFSSLFIGLATMALIYIAMTVVVDGILIQQFGGIRLSFNPRRLAALLGCCLPMFVNAFMMMYINNAPKYALDRYMPENALAVFSALFMVSFVMSIFTGMIMNPLITGLSAKYNSCDMAGFLRLLGRQLLYVFGFSMVCLAGAFIAGTQILSLAFKLDLSAWRTSLCLLMMGGALLAVYQVLEVVLVVIRRQSYCLIGIFLTVAVSAAITPAMVRARGIDGASASYLIAMLTMATAFSIITAWFLCKPRTA